MTKKDIEGHIIRWFIVAIVCLMAIPAFVTAWYVTCLHVQSDGYMLVLTIATALAVTVTTVAITISTIAILGHASELDRLSKKN